ncbi:MAG: GDSL-type esterase/lipase family protein, partial [Ferrovibrio sp.]
MKLYGRYGFSRRCHNVAALFAVMLITLLSAMPHAEAQNQAAIRLLVFGDSLVAGYNLPPDASYPAQLEKALKAKGVNATVMNAGVSGDTTAAAASRLDWALAD